MCEIRGKNERDKENGGNDKEVNKVDASEGGHEIARREDRNSSDAEFRH